MSMAEPQRKNACAARERAAEAPALHGDPVRSAEKPSRPKLRSVDPERVSRGDEAEARAAALYDSGYWCGEAVVATVNELAGHPLPPDISRLASGFCEGFGGSRCTCGALAGAVMAAGMFVGRIGPDEPWEPVYDAAGELRHRFVLDQCATTCDEIARRYGGMHKPERWAHCAELVGKCARWTVEIGEDQGWL